MNTSDVREAWAGYECRTDRMVFVGFPGLNVTWLLRVADRSAPIWRVVSTIMAEENYLFLEAAGGTYNCRPPSLHAYGLALDLNPSKNPYRCPMKTNMPANFIRRMKSIRANGKRALTWGGDWPCSNPPDPMHWQLAVGPEDCHTITYDRNPTQETTLLPIRADSPIEDIRMCQSFLGAAPTGKWDFKARVVALAQRSGTGDPVGKRGDQINGVMYAQMIEDYIRKVAPGDGTGLPLLNIQVQGRVLS